MLRLPSPSPSAPLHSFHPLIVPFYEFPHDHLAVVVVVRLIVIPLLPLHRIEHVLRSIPGRTIGGLGGEEGEERKKGKEGEEGEERVEREEGEEGEEGKEGKEGKEGEEGKEGKEGEEGGIQWTINIWGNECRTPVAGRIQDVSAVMRLRVPPNNSHSRSIIYSFIHSSVHSFMSFNVLRYMCGDDLKLLKKGEPIVYIHHVQLRIPPALPSPRPPRRAPFPGWYALPKCYGLLWCFPCRVIGVNVL